MITLHLMFLIHHFSPSTSELYCGLYRHLLEFCSNNGYEYEIIQSNFYGSPEDINEISISDVLEMVKDFGIKFEPRDYQLKTVQECLKYKRKLILSATSSGKSFSIYCIVRHLTEQDYKTLIITPSTSLVEQLYKDFESYGWEAEKYCHKIYSGKSKTTNLPVIISTYQSLAKMPKKYFDYIGAVIVDECFSGESKVLTPSGYKPIKDIQIGDEVINYNEDTKEFKTDLVVNTYKNLSKSGNEKMLKMTFDNGKIIEVTANHKFLTNLGWVRADQLTNNHEVINYEY